MNTPQTETQETVLTAGELKRMADTLSEIREIIELYNHALNLVPHGKKTRARRASRTLSSLI